MNLFGEVTFPSLSRSLLICFMDFGVSPCLPSSFHRPPSPLIFLRNPSEKNIWWSKGIQLAGHEGNKPMSSLWPLSLVGTWWDPSSVPTFAAAEGITAVSPAFHLRATVLLFFLNLFNDNSGLWWGFNPALSSLFSPWSLFKRSLIFLKSDSRVPATFLPGVLRAPKPFPFAQGTCFSAHFLLSLRE